MPSSRPCSIFRGSFTHRKTRHKPAQQPPHLPQGPRGAPCLFSFGRVRYRGLRCVVGVLDAAAGLLKSVPNVLTSSMHTCKRQQTAENSEETAATSLRVTCPIPDMFGVQKDCHCSTLSQMTCLQVGLWRTLTQEMMVSRSP